MTFTHSNYCGKCKIYHDDLFKCPKCGHGRSYEDRIKKAVDAAVDAAWDAIAREYPEIETGDISPEDQISLFIRSIRRHFEMIVRRWVDFNGYKEKEKEKEKEK